jgi:hypothetical protein
MLAKDPGQRYASARDLIRELRNLRIEGLGDDWVEWFEEADTSLLETAVSAALAGWAGLARRWLPERWAPVLPGQYDPSIC